MYYISRNNEHIVWITVFVFVSVLESIKAVVKHDNDTIIKTSVKSSSCECIHYDCGCCGHIEIDAVSINAIICSNATYLEHDYGFSVTLTYNNNVIINETLSARNPPPICIGEDFIQDFPLECCLRLYDIDINGSDFRCCFELEAKLAKLNILPIKLGCIDRSVSSSNLLLSQHINVYFSIFAVLLSYMMFN